MQGFRAQRRTIIRRKWLFSMSCLLIAAMKIPKARPAVTLLVLKAEEFSSDHFTILAKYIIRIPFIKHFIAILHIILPLILIAFLHQVFMIKDRNLLFMGSHIDRIILPKILQIISSRKCSFFECRQNLRYGSFHQKHSISFADRSFSILYDSTSFQQYFFPQTSLYTITCRLIHICHINCSINFQISIQNRWENCFPFLEGNYLNIRLCQKKLQSEIYIDPLC